MYKDIKIVLLTTILVIVSIFSVSYISFRITACKQARIYNIQNDTNWTCSDFFWASEQINSNTQTIKIK